MESLESHLSSWLTDTLSGDRTTGVARGHAGSVVRFPHLADEVIELDLRE
jgi:hypothetical protein